MQIAPVITANDPLPPDAMQVADAVRHAAGDMLMRASRLSVAMRSGAPLGPLGAAAEAIAAEARAIAEACDHFARVIEALQARAAA